MLWYAGSERVSGAEAALFTALAPVSAVVLAVALLGESVSANQVIGIGIACVMVAVLSLGWTGGARLTAVHHSQPWCTAGWLILWIAAPLPAPLFLFHTVGT